MRDSYRSIVTYSESTIIKKAKAAKKVADEMEKSQKDRIKWITRQYRVNNLEHSSRDTEEYSTEESTEESVGKKEFKIEMNSDMDRTPGVKGEAVEDSFNLSKHEVNLDASKLCTNPIGFYIYRCLLGQFASKFNQKGVFH